MYIAKLLQSCPTLCDPIDGSPPCSPVPGVLQARTLEWVAISFPNAWKWKMKVKTLSRVRLCATPWTAAHQAPLSMGFSRQEYWSGVPLPSLNMYITICKIEDQCKFDVWSRAFKAGALGQPRGMVGSDMGGAVHDGQTHVYLWLIHVDVWQKPP